MDSYKIIFKGEVLQDSKRDKIKVALARHFKIPVEKADILFNGNSYSLKKGLTKESATELIKKFALIGIKTHLIKEEEVVSDITKQAEVTPVAPIVPEQNRQPEVSESESEPSAYICKDCGSRNVVKASNSEVTETNQNKSNSESSPNTFLNNRKLKAFLFSAYYFAGHGQFKKALLIIVLCGWSPLFWLFASIFCSLKVDKFIPESSTPFSWQNPKKLAIVHVIIFCIVNLIFIWLWGSANVEMTEYGELHDF